MQKYKNMPLSSKFTKFKKKSFFEGYLFQYSGIKRRK
jgi:hypothetical protein